VQADRGGRTQGLRRAAIPALGALVLLALGHRGPALALVGVASVLVVLGAAAPATFAAIDRGLIRAGTVLGRVVGRVLAAMAWVLLVLPLWAVHRIAGLAPLGDRPGRRSVWDASAPRLLPGEGRLAARHQSGPEPARLVPRRGRRVARVVLIVLPFVCGAIVLTSNGGPLGDPLTYRSFGHEDEPFARRLFADLHRNDQGHPWTKWDSVRGWTVRDGTSRYINVRDGARRSYAPDRPEITVWFFGGSTMFGLGQRDTHTIASEVARLAEADGIRIRAVNYGVLGYLNWQEVQRFAELLTSGATADLAVFYDGANELVTADQRADLGDGDLDAIQRQLVSGYERDRAADDWAIDRELGVPSATRVRVAARQYVRGVDLAGRLGDSYDVPTTFVWQPTLISKRQTRDDLDAAEAAGIEPHLGPALPDPTLVQVRREGVEPVDLTAALDGADEIVFLDGAHTNELGARLIARELYERLRPQLRELADRGS
jgi:lysophospholipase L1-like esterase